MTNHKLFGIPIVLSGGDCIPIARTKKVVVHFCGDGPHRAHQVGDKFVVHIDDTPRIGTVENITEESVIVSLTLEEVN